VVTVGNKDCTPGLELSAGKWSCGSGKGASQIVEVVRVGMNLNGSEKKELSWFAVPHICEPLSGQSIMLCVDTCKHLDLADSVVEESDQMAIDILIGSDYYW
jgi:hypothetical protein